MIVRLIAIFALMGAMVVKAAEPAALQLPSGKQVTVLGVQKSALNGSGEIALVLKYQTSKDFYNIMSVAAEVEDVWVAFKPIAEQQGVSAAVVVASEAPKPFVVTKSAGWVWKRAADGSWHPPRENDHALVPRQ